MPPALTAIVPTHNRPHELRRTVESVRSQTVTTAIVVVDDGSDPPVQPDTLPDSVHLIRHRSPLGPAAARNAGVAAADSEWIGFLDDDDLWLPTKAESVLAAAADHAGADVVFHRTAWEPSPDSHGRRHVTDPLSRVLRQQPPHLSGVIVRKEVHERILFDETMWATQDLDYLIRLASHSTNWLEIRQDLSKHGSKPPEGSAIDIESRIAGRLSLLGRHGDLIRGDPQAHSFFMARLGHQYRRAERYGEARKAFLEAIRINVSSGVAWRGLARTLLEQARSA